MLNWFEVENFKSIKKLHLDFRPFMVFVGPNGAGKTNILEALTLFLDILVEGSTEPIELYGGYDQLVRRAKRRARAMRFALSASVEVSDWEGVMEVEVVLRSGSDAEGIRVESELLRLTAAGRAPAVARWKNGELVEFERERLQIFQWSKSFLQRMTSMRGRHALALSWLLRATFLSLEPVTRLRLDASALRRDAQLQRSRHGRLLGLNGEGLPLAVERLRGTEAFRRVLARLQEVYPRIEDVETVHILPGQVALKFKERLIEEGLGQANVSDGVMHALALFIALEGGGAESALAIEEPENALHPWALRKLIERAQEFKRTASLLVTTHSPTLIDAVRDPEVLFIVENDARQGTIVTPALKKERALRAILAESGQKLGEVWLDGSLGGIPEREE